jgi:hypothetical protein
MVIIEVGVERIPSLAYSAIRLFSFISMDHIYLAFEIDLVFAFTYSLWILVLLCSISYHLMS